MQSAIRKSLSALGLVAVVAAVAGAGFAWSGAYNVAADDPHTRPVHAVLQSVRERSIAARAQDLQVPDLEDPARIVQGAGNYDAMCTGCHLAPGATETELSKGLYPVPPNLTRERVDAAEAFWVIKHGIKASGMPAWGRSMEDVYIWNMVAFLQELPGLDAEAYRAMVARSGGHSHGGGESGGHAHAGAADHDGGAAAADHPHPEGTAATDHHGQPAAGKPAPAGTTTHVHADGKQHVHAPATPAKEPAKPTEPAAAEPAPAADGHDGHDHQH